MQGKLRSDGFMTKFGGASDEIINKIEVTITKNEGGVDKNEAAIDKFY